MSMTKEKPILFTPDMAQKCHVGTKTQTRRLVKGGSEADFIGAAGDDRADPRNWGWLMADGEYCTLADGGEGEAFATPPYKVGDVLFVREAWKPYIVIGTMKRASEAGIIYGDGAKRKDERAGPLWSMHRPTQMRPSLHMPRWACRTLLEVTEVRVQRLHDIGKDGRRARDALAEGITREQIAQQEKFFHPDDCPALAFAALWESINGKGSWSKNPWVWAYSLKRIEPK